MKWGKEEKFLRIMSEKGFPSAYNEKPELTDYQHFVWNGFCELSERRQVGMEASPLSYSDMEFYATLHLVRGVENLQSFIYLISKLDFQWRLNGNSKDDPEC